MDGVVRDLRDNLNDWRGLKCDDYLRTLAAPMPTSGVEA
jgi:hypothetical protein